jgi:hypothetical protein
MLAGNCAKTMIALTQGLDHRGNLRMILRQLRSD